MQLAAPPHGAIVLAHVRDVAERAAERPAVKRCSVGQALWTCWRSIGDRREPSWTRWMLQSVRSRLPALLVYVADTATLKVVARVGREGAHPLGHVTCQMAEGLTSSSGG